MVVSKMVLPSERGMCCGVWWVSLPDLTSVGTRALDPGILCRDLDAVLYVGLHVGDVDVRGGDDHLCSRHGE